MDFVIENPKVDNIEHYARFYAEMIKGITAKQKIYKDSWKTMTIRHLEKRLLNKIEDYILTRNPDKLISIANLSMFIYLRKKE